MRQRRNKRKFNHYLYDNLKIAEKVLIGLIIFCLLIFIYSSLKVKNSTFASKNKVEENIVIGDASDENNINNEPINLEANSTEENKVSEPTDTTINMAFTGDIMCHNTIYNDAFDSATETYDFSYIFENVKYYLQTADITVGNLETTFAGAVKGYSSYPKFNTPEGLAYTLKKLGFDVLSTANNHCYDSGYAGIESTIKHLDNADISHTGTYTSKEAQDTILIKNVRGIQVAFLSFTYGTNGITIPSDKSFSVNLSNKETILNQLQLAKNQKPDLICVCMHWGVEYQTKPNSEQQNLANFLFQNGADLIIGNHPHVLQPMEKREITLADGTKKDGFIVYSLGNFLADQNKTYTRDSAILNVKITKNKDGKISINSATHTPTYIDKLNAQKQKFKLIDLKNLIASYDAGYETTLDEKKYNLYITELNNITNILGAEIK